MASWIAGSAAALVSLSGGSGRSVYLRPIRPSAKHDQLTATPPITVAPLSARYRRIRRFVELSCPNGGWTPPDSRAPG